MSNMKFRETIGVSSKWVYLLVILLLNFSCAENAEKPDDEPEPEEPQEPVFSTVYLADPSIFKSEDTYYL